MRYLTLPRLALALALACAAAAQPLTYPIVDTGQDACFDNYQQIAPPVEGQSFYGQDAQYSGHQPSYQDNGNGTVSDLVTGLMWQKEPDLEQKATFREALEGAKTFRMGGYSDWRLPTLKELYSLIDFRGSAPRNIPYIDAHYFAFRFGEEARGERPIDAQYWSSTPYLGTTFGGSVTQFGVNFADGRIKGYPRDMGPRGEENRQFVRYVRGPTTYGKNDFVDTGKGTITDRATGLTWTKGDSGSFHAGTLKDGRLNWEQALAWAEGLDFAGHSDWRLPNAKELQSIVDYDRAPDATDPAKRGPAIAPIFDITEPESYFWTSTTHLDTPQGATQAVYLAFGRACGVWRNAWGQTGLWDVHGAGAQRSDPKAGNPDYFPYGRGPQADDIRIFNYARAVRGGLVEAGGQPSAASSAAP